MSQYRALARLSTCTRQTNFLVQFGLPRPRVLLCHTRYTMVSCFEITVSVFPIAAFACNLFPSFITKVTSAVIELCISSKFSPFQIIYGIVPRAPPDLSTLPDRTRLHGGAEQTTTNLETSVQKYKAAADAHRRRLIFEVGDLVWAVLTRDRMPAHSYNKLKAKKIGPLEVLERINDNAYRLRLPADITTSDVFNIKYLSRYFPPEQPSDSRANPLHLGRPDAATSELLKRQVSFS
ncbi:hypothetical protein Bca52824_003752 [Brassica carinata]|uniref:Tf2-1-like SH3-like domain-containing protein n=1 Tax=Brassica carinata TaxID=52824 RepID=A0A8X8BEZ1_BRACI|nr:hypothetical protein Bca52824_003752 [Brassica carinata]